MQPQSLRTAETEWIDKWEASKRLNLGHRAVLDAAAKGKIRSMKGKGSKGPQLSMLFHAGDVERYAYEREHPEENAKGILTNFPMPEPLRYETRLMEMTLANGLTIRASDARGKLGLDHETEHYRIKEWTKPGPDCQFHKFKVDGPGNHDYLYVALEESCGPQLILGLEKAYQAGLNAAGGGKQQWVTAEQAASITGLPASVLAGLIKSAALKAIDCGPRPGGRYRIKRSDLDALEGMEQ